MKKFIFILTAFIFVASITNAQEVLNIMKNGEVVANYKIADIDTLQFKDPAGKATTDNETLYIVKNGVAVASYKVNDIDSIVFYAPIYKFTDSRDGNEYKYIKIGKQYWMAENLKFLPKVYKPTNIPENGVSGKEAIRYYVPGYVGTDVAAAKATEEYKHYGVLYNWFAANDGDDNSNWELPSGKKGVCPDGWHLPSIPEYQLMAKAVGGIYVTYANKFYYFENIGPMFKDNTGDYWKNNLPGITVSNSTGFSARPAGSTSSTGAANFLDFGTIAYFWTSSLHKIFTSAGMSFFLQNKDNHLREENYNAEYGFSVRCVKDDDKKEDK